MVLLTALVDLEFADDLDTGSPCLQFITAKCFRFQPFQHGVATHGLKIAQAVLNGKGPVDIDTRLLFSRPEKTKALGVQFRREAVVGTFVVPSDPGGQKVPQQAFAIVWTSTRTSGESGNPILTLCEFRALGVLRFGRFPCVCCVLRSLLKRFPIAMAFFHSTHKPFTPFPAYYQATS